ncbi:MAG: hypothetical protein QF516_13355, partial [Pirellulaceae bacterium]|nr:hypothetical protein [Pirellulaceae bacterium]
GFHVLTLAIIMSQPARSLRKSPLRRTTQQDDGCEPPSPPGNDRRCTLAEFTLTAFANLDTVPTTE